MRKLARLLFYIFALLFLLLPFTAHAQSPDQRQFAYGSTGSANAQNVAVPNYQLNVGVVIRFVPSLTNTGPATINVNNTGNVPAVRMTLTGVQPLVGGEIVNGQTTQAMFDGARFVLLSSGYVTGLNQLPATPTGTVLGNTSGTTQPAAPITTLPGNLTIPGPVITNATVNGATLTSATIGLGSNACTNIYQAENASFTPIAGSSGSFFSVINRSTVTFSSTAGFYPAGYCVTIQNANSNQTVPVVLPGGVTYWLWPGQIERVYNVNGTLVYTGPRRYAVRNVTLYVGQAGSCNNANDGLTQNAAGQVCTISQAITLLTTNFDGLGTNPTIQLADGNYTQETDLAGQCVCFRDGITLNGHAGAVASVLLTAPASGYVATVRDYGILFLQNLEITCPAGSLGGLNASQFSTIDLNTVIIGSCNGLTMLEAQDGGHIDFDGGVTVAGSGAQFVYAVGAGSQVTMTNQVIACSGNPTFSAAFVEAVNLSHINAPGSSFSGCGSVSGTRYIGDSLAIIDTGGQGANFFPGTIAGTTTNGAIYK